VEELIRMQTCDSAVNIRPMAKGDIQQVGEIDREAFPTMWPPVNFGHELTNRLAHYIVAADGHKSALPTKVTEPPQVLPHRSFLGFRWPFRAKSASTKPESNEFISGFLGMWLMVDEAHIINVAVREVCRGRGIGELLLISGVELAHRLNATVATLEVRASNQVAQNLYVKYGFNHAGTRKKYYTDNNEDALIMTTDLLSLSSYQEKFEKLKTAHLRKLGHIEGQTGDSNNPRLSIQREAEL
jgi:[ribosomal protein S18]-alanine N-acetyltransferase